MSRSLAAITCPQEMELRKIESRLTVDHAIGDPFRRNRASERMQHGMTAQNCLARFFAVLRPSGGKRPKSVSESHGRFSKIPNARRSRSGADSSR